MYHQRSPAELVDKVPKKVFDDGSLKIETGTAFKPPQLAETAPHLMAAEDSDGDSVDWTEFEYPDDYIRCLNHQEGDFDLFPIDLQEKACDFARNHIWPAVLVYLKEIFPSFCNFSVTDLEKEGLYLSRRVEGIPEELMYDLHQASRYLRPYRSRKIDGKRYIGNYIRICNAIEKEDLGVQIRQIVEKCFTPHEYQDPKDSYRAGYGLKVEPSTGGIQCSCCKEK